MLEIHKKYFWDGTGNISPEFILRRIIEYASFADLLKYPFEGVKEYIHFLNVDKFRTGEKRKQLIKELLPYIDNSYSWEEAFEKLINSVPPLFALTPPKEN